jgi:hypothetical protein
MPSRRRRTTLAWVAPTRRAITTTLLRGRRVLLALTLALMLALAGVVALVACWVTAAVLNTC